MDPTHANLEPTSAVECDRKQSSSALFAFAFLTISLSSGLVYGWPSLRRNLVSKEDSSLDEKTLGLIFTIGSWSTQGGRFVIGVARDRWLGTQIATCVSLLAVTAGCIGIAFSDANNGTALAVSMFFVGLGSGGQLCLQPVAGLFPKEKQGIILASLSGAFQISGLAFLVLTAITEDRKKSFGVFFACLIALTAAAAMVLPKNQFVNSSKTEEIQVQEDKAAEERKSETVEEEFNENVEEYAVESSESNKLSESKGTRVGTIASSLLIDETQQHNRENIASEKCEKDTPNNLTNFSRDEKTAMELMRSAEYMLLVAWFCIIVVPSQYYIATIGYQLEQKGDSGTYTALFSIIYASSAVFGPISGKIADAFGLGVAQALATILQAASLFILASDNLNLNAQIVGMCFYGIGRLTLFGMFFTNVGKRFGYTHFGTLAGCGLLLSAIGSLTQYPLIAIAVEGGESVVNTMCGVAILALLLPYCFWLGLRERRECRNA